MTNGEKMQEMYPDIKILKESENILEYSLDGKVHRVKKRWWNAEHPERKRRMTNREFFFKAFPCLKQDEEWPNLLWWIDKKGKRQLLGDIYDSNFWDAEYKEPTTKSDLPHNLCDSCANIRCEFQSGIVRTKCAFYMPSQLDHGQYAIKALEQEPRWISVSERLPEEHICDDGYHEPSKSVLVQMKSGAMHTARYWSRYDKKWLDLNYPTTDEVIAWMPLPKPYKAESENP